MTNDLVKGASRLGIELTSRQQEQFQIYGHELVLWNRKFNLTAITDGREIELKHFLDSLTLAVISGYEETQGQVFNIIDVGSGAGFPGLPLKILYAEASLVLLEATAKKTSFLRHIISMLHLENVEVVTGRAEEMAHLPVYREQFSLAVSRALAPMPTMSELALPFCRIGGKFVAYKKGDIQEELAEAGNAIALLGGDMKQVRKVSLEEMEDRYLIVVDKVAPTPEKFPRRTGVPKRRPL